jgi:predicted branched-subunit amino acid permease
MSAATRGDLMAGARGMLPLMLAVAPQGLSLGLALGQMPHSHLAGWATSGLLYAGSSQLALMSTYASSGAAAILVALIVNLRLLLYSAALAPQWRERSLSWRLVAGYVLVDPSFVLAQKRNSEPGSARSRSTYYLGGALLLWLWWQVITGVGILAPHVIPHLGALWAAAPLCFVALLAGAVKEPKSLVAAGTALVASVGLGGLPLSSGLGLAMMLGLATASVRWPRPATAAAAPAGSAAIPPWPAMRKPSPSSQRESTAVPTTARRETHDELMEVVS